MTRSGDSRLRPIRFALTVLLVALGTVGASQALPASARTSRQHEDPFRPEALIATVRTLADTAWTGRGAGTPGLDSAAAYLERRFARAGLRPAGDGRAYRQGFDINTGVSLEGENSLVTRRGGPWQVGRDFLPLGFSAGGAARAPVVFAGYGITAPELHYDDYAGIDARGRIAVILRYEPGEDDSTSRFDGRLPTLHSELRNKAINAREHGALGILVVTGPRYHEGEEELPALRADAAYMSAGLVGASVTRALVDSLLVRHGLTVRALQDSIDGREAPHSIEFPDTVGLTIELARKTARAFNIVGVLPGREHGADGGRSLVVGAHYDHLGLGGEYSLAPQAYGLVHPGADDNASGTSALLAVAEAEAQGERPRHDLVFIAFAGEEMGLVGSSWYTDHPAVPLAATDAMLNMDMVGRLRDSKLLVMGTGTGAEFHGLLDSLNAALPAAERFDLKTTDDGYGPSDHSSFYRRKVPVLFFFTGAHADYHKPSDTWDKVDGPGLSRVARFVDASVRALDARPRVTFEEAKEDTTHRMALRGGHGAWLGTIPDYTQTEGGVLLSGVRDASPAAAAGIKGGDVLVRIDDVKIDNIYDFTFVLQARRPGDVVRVVVRRGGKEETIVVTLGKRAS